MKALIAIALLVAGTAFAANFGPAPDFVTDDPNISVEGVNAYVQTKVLALSVNGIWYNTLQAPYVYMGSNGTHALYQVTDFALYATDGSYITASVLVEYWTTTQCSGRGGCRRTPHNFVDSGSVTLP